MSASSRGYRTIRFQHKKIEVAVYTSARTADALREILDDASLYQGVRITQVLEAVYAQGRKDGARAALDALDRKVAEVRSEVPHQRPGRPRKHPKRTTGTRLRGKRSGRSH